MTHPQTQDDEALARRAVRDAGEAINRLLPIRQRWWLFGAVLLFAAPIALLANSINCVAAFVIWSVGCLYQVAHVDRLLAMHKAAVAYHCDLAALTAFRNHEGRK